MHTLTSSIPRQTKELQTFLLLLGLLGAGFRLKSGSDGVILTLTVAGNFNTEKLYTCDQDGVCLCVILQRVKTHQRGKAVVLYLFLELLTEWSPFLPNKKTVSEDWI